MKDYKAKILMLKKLNIEIKPKITLNRLDLSILENDAKGGGYGIKKQHFKFRRKIIEIRSYVILSPYQYCILFGNDDVIMVLKFKSIVHLYDNNKWYGKIAEIEYNEKYFEVEIDQIEDKSIIESYYELISRKGKEIIKVWTHEIFQFKNALYIFECMKRNYPIEIGEVPNFMLQITEI